MIVKNISSARPDMKKWKLVLLDWFIILILKVAIGQLMYQLVFNEKIVIYL